LKIQHHFSAMDKKNRWYSGLHNLPPLAEDGTDPVSAKSISPNMSQLRWLQTQIQKLPDDFRTCTKVSELRLCADSLTPFPQALWSKTSPNSSTLSDATFCQQPQKCWKTPSRRQL
jgi:hypothetical protein